jgi:hypothetical protein
LEEIEAVVRPIAELITPMGEGRFENLSHVGMVLPDLSRIGRTTRVEIGDDGIAVEGLVGDQTKK